MTATRGRPLPVRPRLAGVADGVTATRGRPPPRPCSSAEPPGAASSGLRSGPLASPARLRIPPPLGPPRRPTNMQTPGRTRSLTSLAEPRPRVSLPNGPPGPCFLPLIWGVQRSPGGGGDRGTEPRLHRVFQWLPCGPQEASWPDMCAPTPSGHPSRPIPCALADNCLSCSEGYSSPPARDPHLGTSPEKQRAPRSSWAGRGARLLRVHGGR